MPSSTQELLAMARQSVSPPLAPFTQRIERDIVQPLVPAVEFIVAAVTGETAASESQGPPPSTETTVLHHAHTVTQTVATGLSVVSAVAELPVAMMDTATAMISNAIVPAGFGTSALPAVTGMHIGMPHTHVHPPSLIPPAPPIPLPSMGVVMGAGCVSVLIHGMPAIRTGDFGFAVTCGSFGPTFEIITGSASVYVGGKRAARVLDFTRICNPLPASTVTEIMQGALTLTAGAAQALPIVNDIVGALSASSESADACAASAEASDPNEAASLAADAVAMSADAQGQLQSAMLATLQLAADAASFAATALIGMDPGIAPGLGTTLAVPGPFASVQIGGLPLPPSQLINSRIANALRRLGPRRRRVTASLGEFMERARHDGEGGGGGGQHRHGEEEHGGAIQAHPEANGRRAECGDPVNVIHGNVLSPSLDCDLGGLLRFSRHYDSAHRARIGPMGRGMRHFYERELRVYLDRCVYVSETGVEITFAAFRGRHRLVRFGAVLERELTDRGATSARYTLRYRGVKMVFVHAVSARTGRTGAEVHSSDAGVHATLIAMESAEGSVALSYGESGELGDVHAYSGDSSATISILFQYDHNGRIKAVESKGGRGAQVHCSYRFDAHQRLLYARDACGGEEGYAYDEAHGLITRWDRSQVPFRWRYDEKQRCVWASGEGGFLEYQFEYKPGATVVTSVSEGETTFHHNALGVLTRITYADGSTLEREIDEWQWCVSETDPAGRKVTWCYDETGHHFARVDRFGRALAPGSEDSSFEAKAPSLPSKLAEQLGAGRPDPTDTLLARGIDPRVLAVVPLATHAFVAPALTLRNDNIAPVLPPPTRDALGQMVAQPTPRGTRHAAFDSVGNCTLVVDQDGVEEHVAYAYRNLPARITDGNGQSIELAHTGLGQVARLRDALGSTSEYIYGTHGGIEQVIRHGRVWESYAYEKGLLTEKRDSLGQPLLTIEAHENALPKCIKLSSGEAFTYDYDRRGQVIKASSLQHDVRMRWSPTGGRRSDTRDGRGIHRSDAEQGATRARVEHRFFERFAWQTEHERFTGREMRALHLPTGAWIRFETVPGVVHRACSSGARELLQFREDGHLIAQAVFRAEGAPRGWHHTLQYVRTAEGDIRTLWDSSRGARHFEYDKAHWLIAERDEMAGKEARYALDPAGNLVSSRHVLRAEYSVGNLLVRADDETFTYDHRGRTQERVRGDEKTSYEYDSWDQLIAIRQSGKGEWRATYDGLGRRITFGRATSRTELYWDGDRIAGEVRPDGRVRIYLYLDAPEGSHEGAQSLIPIAFLDYASASESPESGRLHHVFHDAAGMPHHIEDDAGKVVWRALHTDAYGAVTVDSKSTVDYALRWPGHRFDEETGLHYNRYRDYDPKLGRYLEPDPLGHAGGVNLYAYSKNPMVDVDLLGLRSLCERENDIRNAFLEATGRPLTESMELQLNGLMARLRANSSDIEADLALRRLSRDWRTEHEGGLPRLGGDPNAPRRAPGEALNASGRTAAQEAHFRRRIDGADARGDLNGANQARYDRHIGDSENAGRAPYAPADWQPRANSALSNGERGRAHENAVLNDLAIENNNYGASKTWPTPNGAETRPDAVTDRSVIDVKSMPDEPPRRTYNDSDQLRGERDMAAQSGKAHVVILTNGNRDNVKPSEPLARPAEEPGGPQTTVYHRDHRGTWSLWNSATKPPGWETAPRPNL